MPFEKILITHKFGIISQSHKKQLQERLIQRRLNLENQARKQRKGDENINLQITEEFVKEYNEASYEKRVLMNNQCSKIYEKIKKKLLNPNNTDDLIIQLSWAELSQLMQCSSPRQEECMDLFIISMESANLSASQIPTLFFLAETVIYWIRTDTINQPFLRAFEIKLLKIGMLIFQRIYFHFIEGTLDNQDELKEHLSIYLQGFEELRSAYSPYPEAVFYMNFMIHVGVYLIQSIGSNLKNNSDFTKADNRSDVNMNPTIIESLSIDTNKQRVILNDYLPVFKKIESVSSLLWNSSDLYNLIIKKASSDLADMVMANVLESSLNVNQEDWIDAILAFYIIGECAKINMKSLHIFLSMSLLKSNNLSDLNESMNSTQRSLISKDNKYGIESWRWELGAIYIDVLTDICLNATQTQIKRKALLGFNKDASDAIKNRKLKQNLAGFGLLDMARFEIIAEPGEEDWSWRLRYTAIKSIVNICKTLVDKDNEEFRQTCWSCLVVFQETETDSNVLEALKVGQINSKIEEKNTDLKLNLSKRTNQLSKAAQIINNQNVYCQIAFRLNDLNGKRVEDLKTVSSKTASPVKASSKSKSDSKFSKFNKSNIEEQDILLNSIKEPEGIKKNRTTLQEEINMSNQFQVRVPGYFSRKNIDLMRIVEDQYRKEEKHKFEQQLEENL